MAEYIVGSRLENVLLNNGFVEVNNREYKNSDKKCFKSINKRKFNVYFDYINIRVIPDKGDTPINTSLTITQIKTLIFYTLMKTPDIKEVWSDGAFSFGEIETRLVNIKDELSYLEKHDVKKSRRDKLNQILELYQSIHF